MASRGPRHLRKTTNMILDALRHAAETSFHGQPIGMNTLAVLIEKLKDNPDFDELYRHAYRELMEVIEAEKLERQRSNFFGRLMVHPLGSLLADGTLTRDMLPNIFSFLHLVLGEDADRFGDECHAIVTELRQDLGEDFAWDAFYDDVRAKRIMWQALVRVASSFKRYDLRRDWFIKLMQYQPTTVSTASNAFVVRERDEREEPRHFGNREFCEFFSAWFEPLRDLPPADAALFQDEFGTDPHHLIGPFLVKLSMCPV